MRYLMIFRGVVILFVCTGTLFLSCKPEEEPKDSYQEVRKLTLEIPPNIKVQSGEYLDLLDSQYRILHQEMPRFLQSDSTFGNLMVVETYASNYIFHKSLNGQVKSEIISGRSILYNLRELLALLEDENGKKIYEVERGVSFDVMGKLTFQRIDGGMIKYRSSSSYSPILYAAN